MHERMHHDGAALLHYSRVAHLEPRNHLARHGCALKSQLLGDCSAASRHLLRCIELRPEEQAYTTGCEQAQQLLRQVEEGHVVQMCCIAPAVLRQKAQQQSRPTGAMLHPGQVIAVMATQRHGGAVRVQTDRGWASVADADGGQRALVDSEEWQRRRLVCCSPATLRAGPGLETEVVGELTVGLHTACC